MTSVKHMHTSRRRFIRDAAAALLAAGAFLVVCPGCAKKARLEDPIVLQAPYLAPRVWAVAPFINESGVSTVDAARIADLFTQEIEGVEGLQTVAVNRVIAAMSLLKMDAVASRADAIALLNTLGVDALVIGTVTAHDGFPPFTLGMAVEVVSDEREPALPPFDPREITKTASGEPLAPRSGVLGLAQASGIFDARDHAVRRRLQEYAQGRTIPESAYDDRIYDVSMELYTRFVSYRLLADLLDAERLRVMAKAGENDAAR